MLLASYLGLYMTERACVLVRCADVAAARPGSSFVRNPMSSYSSLASHDEGEAAESDEWGVAKRLRRIASRQSVAGVTAENAVLRLLPYELDEDVLWEVMTEMRLTGKVGEDGRAGVWEGVWEGGKACGGEPDSCQIYRPCRWALLDVLHQPLATVHCGVGSKLLVPPVKLLNSRVPIPVRGLSCSTPPVCALARLTVLPAISHCSMAPHRPARSPRCTSPPACRRRTRCWPCAPRSSTTRS